MMTCIIFFWLSMTALSKNPVKMSFQMVAASMAILFATYTQTGKSWMPTTIYLLFMGGILMMFMILSSMSPNESMMPMSKKTKKMLFTMIFLSSIYSSYYMAAASHQMQGMKMFLTNMMNMPVMVTIMMMYFTLFIKITNKNKNSMRCI